MPGSCAQWASDKEEIMERDLFLRKYRIEQEDFDAAGVSWEELTAIADHYATIEGKLREIGKDFVDKYLYDIEKAGSIPTVTVPRHRGICWRRSSARKKSSRRNLPSWELIITGNT